MDPCHVQTHYRTPLTVLKFLRFVVLDQVTAHGISVWHPSPNISNSLESLQQILFPSSPFRQFRLLQTLEACLVKSPLLRAILVFRAQWQFAAAQSVAFINSWTWGRGKSCLAVGSHLISSENTRNGRI